jgi:hypothetical protein
MKRYNPLINDSFYSEDEHAPAGEIDSLIQRAKQLTAGQQLPT